jgi:hypothetical protein
VESRVWQCARDMGHPAVSGSSFSELAGLAMFAGVWQAGGMKKQASDQAFHDRRHQERKRAEAARKVSKKKVVAEAGKRNDGSRVPGGE